MVTRKSLVFARDSEPTGKGWESIRDTRKASEFDVPHHFEVSLDLVDGGRRRKVERTLVVDSTDAAAAAFVRREFRDLVRRLKCYRGAEGS